MNNQDIRRTAAGAGVKLWQIADALGIADCSFSRKLRKELPQEEKDRIYDALKEQRDDAYSLAMTGQPRQKVAESRKVEWFTPWGSPSSKK